MAREEKAGGIEDLFVFLVPFLAVFFRVEFFRKREDMSDESR
jgi:hypothetical protein